MRRIEDYVERIGRDLVGLSAVPGTAHAGGLVVRIVRDSGNRRFGAWYGGKEITFSLQRVGHCLFNDFPTDMERGNSLPLHAIAHEREFGHLSEKCHSAICDYRARLTQLALEGPRLFKTERTPHAT